MISAIADRPCPLRGRALHARRLTVSAGFAFLLALACERSPEAAGPAARLTPGADLSDTIQAAPSQGLGVQVLGQTLRPESGVAVVFEACPGSDPSDPCSRIFLSSALDSTFSSSAAVATDEFGRAVVRVRLGALVGPVSVKITVPLYGLADSATVTVLPGAAFGVRSLGDTTVDVGTTFIPRAGVVDRAGNLRPDPVTFEAASPALQVSGGSVSALAVGRAYVRVRGTVRGATAIDSVAVTVVPKVRLAVSEEGLRLESLTGGAVRQVVGGSVSDPAWSPAGDRIVYVTASGLAITDTLGQVTPLATPGVTYASWPEYSRDGLWIYFQGGNAYGTQVFRVHPDGTGLEGLQAPTSADNGFYPSPSPDGTRVAYTRYYLLRVKTLATGHVDTLATPDYHPYYTRWSPDGSWIAFIDNYGGIGVIRPDGSGMRALGNGNQTLTWSPDSKWLVAGARDGGLELVDVAAGTVHVLPNPGYSAAWQP